MIRVFMGRVEIDRFMVTRSCVLFRARGCIRKLAGENPFGEGCVLNLLRNERVSGMVLRPGLKRNELMPFSGFGQIDSNRPPQDGSRLGFGAG